MNRPFYPVAIQYAYPALQIYSLSAAHSNCLLLTFAIQRILKEVGMGPRAHGAWGVRRMDYVLSWSHSLQLYMQQRGSHRISCQAWQYHAHSR